MSKRVPSVALVLVLLVLAACGSSSLKGRPVDTKFLPQTVDFLEDVGRGDSIALDSEGNPHMAYIGLIQKPKKGVIPPARPATAPALPAVLTASQADGVFSHGDVVQTDITTSKPVPLPLTEESTTDIAISAKGAIDAVWSQFGGKTPGVWYATAPNAAAPFGDPVKVTSSNGTSPTVAVDQDGNVVVAFVTTNASGSPTIEAAKPDASGNNFSLQQVAVLDPCAAECAAANVSATWTPAGYELAYSDPASGSVMVAQGSNAGWTSNTVEADVGAFGVSIAPGPSGSTLVSYLTKGDARVATAKDPASTWTVVKTPAFATPAQEASGAGTSVAEAQGTTYLAYTDPDDSVALASSRGGATFQRLDTPGTQNGLYPALAVTDAGVVQLSWYESVAQDLMLGLYPNNSQLQLAAPPSPVPYTPPAGGGTGQSCDKGTVEVIAPIGAGGSGYQTPKVTADSGDFKLCFNNMDPTASHNVAIFKDEATATSGGAPLAKDDPFTGPKLDTFDVKGLASGDYYFHCDVHPTTMTGTLTVK